MKRESLQAKVSDLDIFLYFIPDLEESQVKRHGNPGQNISSPFQEDKNPSFSVYEDGSRKLKFKCHSTGKQGDVFQLIADLNDWDCKTRFNDILKLINEQMKLGLATTSTTYQSEVWKATYYPEFTKIAIDFWQARNIDKLTLEAFGVRQMKRLNYQQNKNKRAAKYDYHRDGAVAFEFTINGRKKLYMPSSVNPNLKKKYYCKTQTNQDIFGWRQLPRKKQKYILICEGESDVMCAYAHGIPAVCFQSANVHVAKQQIRDLKRRASHLILCYDMDDAGRKGANKINYKYPSVIDLEIPIHKFYSIGKEKSDLGKLIYWSEMDSNQLEIYDAVDNEEDDKQIYNDLSDWLPNASVSELKSMIDHSIKANRKSRYLHIWEQGKAYMKFNKKSGEIEEVSNFILEVDAQIMKAKKSFRLCRFISRERTTDTIAVPSDVLSSDTKFTEFVGNLRGNFQFFGTKKDLLAIQKLTFELCDYLEEVPRMGWNGKFDCFVLSNAVLNGTVQKPNAEGIVDMMYIPAANDNNLEDATFATDLKFRYAQDSSIKQPYQFYDILANSYNPRVASVCFSFLFSGLFFDWIARKGVSGWFPLLGLFGQKGSGKGSLIKMLMQLFTSEPEEVSISGSTRTGFVRTLEQVANIPAWLDEFRNTIGLEKIEGLKNIYDLIGKVIGIKSNDSRTKRSKILRPTFMSGQEGPVNEALFSRCISLNLAIVDKTPEEIRKFSENLTELNKGIGDILFKLLQFRPLIEQGFKEQYFSLVEHFGNEIAAYNLKKGKKVKANIRLLNNYACITAPLIVAMKNGLKLSKDGDSKKEMKVVVEYALKTLIQQAMEESELDEVNKFLEVVMIAATRTKPLLFPGHDFIALHDEKELIIKASVISEFNDMYKKIYSHQGPDQSAIKKYLPTKSYYKGKDRFYFWVTGSDNNVKNAKKTQLWGHRLAMDKLPDETRDYFKKLAEDLKPDTAHAIAN